MRTISAAQSAVLASGVQAEFVRFSVKDSGGTFRDMSTFPGYDALKSIQWKSDVNSPHATFEASLSRELFQLSVNPYVDSAPNRGFDPAGLLVPLLALNREVKIEVAIVAADTQPVDADFLEVFRGRIDSIDAASGWDVRLSGRDLGGRLAQQYIKTELVYAFADDSGTPVSLKIWAPGIVVAAGRYLSPATRGVTDSGFDKFLKCASGGTTGMTEPIWTTGAGQTDGSATWNYIGAPSVAGYDVEKIIQEILSDNKLTGDPSVTLNTPVSPGWSITQFMQQRGFTLDAIRALANQIGWDIRYLYDEGSSTWKLTLYVPERATPSLDHTFAASEYANPTKLSSDIATIRNSVRVIYADASTLWPDGTPKRTVIDVADSASIAKYGELWMELQEEQNGNIDNSTQATQLANSALSDLKDPDAELSVMTTHGFPWVVLNDFLKFKANGLHFTEDQSLAVTAWTQSFESGHLKTQLEFRGKPTIGASLHLAKEQHPDHPVKPAPHRLQHFTGKRTASVSHTSIVGGTQTQIVTDITGKFPLAPPEFEVHIYPVPGTTLDSTTLAAVSTSAQIETGNLTPGATYYRRVVTRFYNGSQIVRGEPSVEESFTAGRAQAGHIEEGIALDSYPLNGGFETRFDPVGMPDHWYLQGGSVLGSNVFVQEDGDGLSGGRYLRVDVAAGGGAMQTANIPIINETAEANRYSQLYKLSCWLKNKGGNAGSNSILLAAVGFDYAGAPLGSSLSGFIAFATDTKTDHWQLVEETFAVSGTDVRSVRLSFGASYSAGQCTVDFDEFRLERVGSPWFAIGDTAKFTENYESVPGFAGTWAAFGSTVPAFRKNQFGRVLFKGAMDTGTIPSDAFTLPPGYRPLENMFFSVDSNSGTMGAGSVGINASTGVVTVYAGDNFRVDLNGISFDTF